MKAIIVPGLSDFNKGDQALVWESYRIIQDTGLFDSISVLAYGDISEEGELSNFQTKEKGIEIIENILKHPRRGKKFSNKVIRENTASIAYQVLNAIKDFFALNMLLVFCRHKVLLSIFFNKKIVNTVNKFHQANAIFIKGGGFIHAYGEVIAPYVMWYFLFHINLAKRLGKKIIVLPNSFGPFRGLFVRFQIKKSLSDVDLILARENISANILSGLLGKEVIVMPDLAFYLKSADKERGRNILERYGLSVQDKLVGITIRPWRFPDKNNPEMLYNKYLNSIKDIINYLNEKEYKAVLFNQSLGPNIHEDDREAVLSLTRLLDNDKENLFTWVNENLTCEELKSVYANLYFLIGTRFHSVIFSIASLIPSIAIAYGGNKTTGIMKDLNMDNCVIHINEINSDVLIERFKLAISNYDSIKECLTKKVRKLEAERKKTIQLVKNYLGFIDKAKSTFGS